MICIGVIGSKTLTDNKSHQNIPLRSETLPLFPDPTLSSTQLHDFFHQPQPVDL